MRKMTALIIGLAVVFTLTITQSYAGGLAGTFAKALVGGVAGDVIDGAGRVVSAGADWAQEEINGGQYSTYIQGDLDADIYNKVNKVETGQNAIVSIGGVSLNGSRFNDDVEFETDNRIGNVYAGDDAYVDVGSISFTKTRVNGETDISTVNKISGGINAGKGTVVRIGDFKTF